MTSRDASGRWLAGASGNPAGKRSVAVDFAALVRRAQGDDGVDAALVRVYGKLLDLAENGDVSAATLLLDRLCAAPKLGLELSVDEAAPRSPQEAAVHVTGIIATAVHGDPPAAATLVGIVLRSVGDPRLVELADVITAKLSEMPVDHARAVRDRN